MCPRSSITTPVPSRLWPRFALLRASAMAFILTRTTAASISSASLSSCAAACWDFWAWGFSLGSCAKAGLTERKHAASAARIRPIIAITPFRVRPRPAPLFCQYTKLLRASDKLRGEFSHERLAPHELLPQSRARARSPAHARFPHGGPRHGRGARRRLCGAPAPFARRLHRVRRLLGPGRMARRPLEPLRHDGRVLLRNRSGGHPHRFCDGAR